MNKKQNENLAEPQQEKEKKGFARFMELIDRDIAKFYKAGLMAFLGLLPFIAAVIAVVGYSPLLLPLAAVGGMIAMPEICGVADTIARSQRGEIGWWWWDTYKKAWKRNLRACLLPGAVGGLLAAAQIYSLYYIAALEDPTREFWMLFAALLVELGITGYYLPMLVCMELPAPTLMRNCFVLFFSHPIKSLLAALLRLIYYAVVLIWFPLSSFILLLGSVWLPLLGANMLLYPVLEKHFGLKEIYEKRRKEQWSE